MEIIKQLRKTSCSKILNAKVVYKIKGKIPMIKGKIPMWGGLVVVVQVIDSSPQE
jgi:hypothetical protein